MTPEQRKAIEAAQAAYDAAPVYDRRAALHDLMVAKIATTPRVDANGRVLPDPEPSPPGGASAPTAA